MSKFNTKDYKMVAGIVKINKMLNFYNTMKVAAIKASFKNNKLY